MSRPGFRKGRPGAGRREGRAGEAADGFISSALFSQAQILHLMKAEFARARRHGLSLGCILMQVDRLPQLVDLHGAGLRESVRQAVSDMIRQKTRGADLLGLVNDDRFLLVLPHASLAGTRLIAERLRDQFAELEVAVDDRPLLLTLSLGITACEDQQTMFFDTIVAQAELAVEQALRQGGNRVVSFAEARILAAEPPAGAPGEPREE